MNEKLQYASMLEIPVSTCNISSVKPKRKRFIRKKKVNDEQVKQQLLEKINGQEMVEEQPASVEEQPIEEQIQLEQTSVQTEQMEVTANVYAKTQKKRNPLFWIKKNLRKKTKVIWKLTR